MAKIKQLEFPYNLLVRIIGVEIKGNNQGELIAELQLKETFLFKFLKRITNLWQVKT